MKKFVLFAAAGLLTTASIVYASVNGNKKEATAKKEVQKEVKKGNCNGMYKKSKCSRYA
ncbi:hypothetical protein [Paracnuella aquatica]|uniref:hypothetical protein n=1 Tax=Paracnuella aquatica TaxID=2268757 RepID=UPI0012D71F63|nr:hypothetical protein [Paracnuella aquatica]